MNTVLQRSVLWCIRMYRLLAPWVFSFGGIHTFSGCRFPVSCSHYAEIAIARYGMMRGSRMALERLAHCHPFSVLHEPSSLL